MKCQICGNETGNIIYHVDERILNKGDKFRYLECKKCGSWSMIDDIKDLSIFYPQDYNPYTRNDYESSDLLKKLYRWIAIRMIFVAKYKNYPYISRIRGIDHIVKRLCGVKINTHSKILDVGCAKGKWLDQLFDAGYKDITGVDLFIPEDRMDGKKWKFVHGDIFSVSGRYDLITLNHSFEHMQNPREVILKVAELLNDGGYCMISIPVAEGRAHKMFGVNYCQLDAPRHLFVLSQKAMKHLIYNAGMHLEYINYDSHGGIFSISEGYRDTNKSHDELMKIPPSERFNRLAMESNQKGDADQAIFIMRKVNGK